MSLSYKELNDLLAFFSADSSSRHIISLELIAANTSNSVTSSAIARPSLPYADSSGGDLDYTAFTDPNGTVFNGSTMASVNGTLGFADDAAIKPRIAPDVPLWLIPCYSIILLFAIVGNVLVITTLVQNRRMRTITNVFLLNLAISDILLGVLCMPVTLVGTLLRHFVFGEFLCKFIPFAQAASVGVSSWTLVAISCERYYAICHPLSSRSWQTLSHAYKIIGVIWCGSLVCMTPIAVVSQLIPTSRQGLQKCREHWPEGSVGYERSYNIFLDLILLVLPLIILCVAYILITRTLYVSIQDERSILCGGRLLSGSLANTTRCHAPEPSSALGTALATPIRTIQNAVLDEKRPTRSQSGFNLNVSFQCQVGGMGGHTTAAIVNGATDEATRLDDESSVVMGAGSPEQLKQHTKLKGDANNQGCETKRKLLTPTDGRHLAYCIRTPSVKSLNRNNNETHTTEGESVEMSCMSTASMTVINVHPHPYQKQQHRQQPHLYRHNQRSKPSLLHHQPSIQLYGERERRKSNSTPSLRITEAALRRSNVTRNLESKKRVVKMLFVLVLEFFVCWTPLYVINTVNMFMGAAIYEYIDYTSISFFKLLAYSSTCCNPITYCFMNAGFRRAFLDTFRGLPPLSSAATAGGGFWRKHPKHHQTGANVNNINLSMAGNSITAGNSLTNTVLDSPQL